MSSHADTIRRVFDWPMAYHSVGELADAKQALDALLAENQRLEQQVKDWKQQAGVNGEAALGTVPSQWFLDMKAENQRLREALERVKRNAESWHGTNPREVNSAYGQQDALNVIAGWCREALAGDTE